MQILSSLCLLEVLPTYVSGHTFEVDFNLNNVATATTKQLFSWVILHDQNMHGNLMTLELKVKAYMQMCWHWHPDVLQSTICGTSKEMSELTSDRIPTTEIFVFRLEQLWDPGGWQVSLVHSICTLKLIASARFVMDIMPPRSRGRFSPGPRVCTCLIKEMELFEVVQWMTSSARSKPISLEYYFHLQYRLFGFKSPQLCCVLTLDGMAWDPGGCFTLMLRGACCLTSGLSKNVLCHCGSSSTVLLSTSIAWGQAMFSGGGSVTPAPSPDWAIGCWAVGHMDFGPVGLTCSYKR